MLARDMIIKYIKLGLIGLNPQPKDLENCPEISHCSIDLSIGGTFWVPKQNVPNPFNVAINDPREYFELLQVPKHQPLILKPLQTVLAHTEEYVGSNTHTITTKIRAKSSASGANLLVGSDALFGDPGFNSRWTLRLTNMSNTTLHIPVGSKVAQIYFHRLETELDEAPLYESHRNKTAQDWSPESMLPKLIKVKQ
jgi:deoxycytidine triphosphate deaminase